MQYGFLHSRNFLLKRVPSIKRNSYQLLPPLKGGPENLLLKHYILYCKCTFCEPLCILLKLFIFDCGKKKSIKESIGIQASEEEAI